VAGWLNDLSERVEDLRWGPWHVLAILCAVVCLRNVLEVTVARNPVYEPLAGLVHYPLAYLGPYLALTLVLAAWAGLAPARVGRVMSLAWVLTLIPPLADLVLHPEGRAPAIGYLFADPAELDWIWVHFFDPTVPLQGTTLGIRLEAFLAVVLGGVFVAIRARSPLRGLGAAATIYPVSLFFFSLPLLVQAALRHVLPGLDQGTMLRGEGLLIRPNPPASADSVASAWLVPLMVLLGIAWWWLERRADSDDRWLRGRLGTSRLPGAAAFLVGAALSGLLLALNVYFPGDKLPPLAPYDMLGTGLLVLGVSLLSSVALRIRSDCLSGPLLGLLLGLAASAALGTAVSFGVLVVPAALLPIGLGLGRSSWERAAIGAAALACAGLGAFAAGWALVIGETAFARLPNELLAWPVLSGLGLGAFLAGAKERTWRAVAALAVLVAASAAGAVLAFRFPALLAVALPVTLGVGLLGIWTARNFDRGLGLAGWLLGFGSLVIVLTGLSAGGPDRLAALEERARCVGRLEFLQGERHQSEGNWKRAKLEYRRALKCQPGYTPAQIALGIGMLEHEGNAKRAIMWLERAVRGDPGSDTALSNLAAAYLRREEPGRALELLDRALEIDPRRLDTLYNRARALDDLGQGEAALRAWRDFARLARGHPDRQADLRFARKRIRKLGNDFGSP
jgi:tetratricopeptide (TPR) repeat protein